jgi:hypothetical protein
MKLKLKKKRTKGCLALYEQTQGRITKSIEFETFMHFNSCKILEQLVLYYVSTFFLVIYYANHFKTDNVVS